jgi:hypothetical protein
MSDYFDDNLDDDEPETSQPQQRRQPTEAEIRIWRKQAKKWEQAEPELTKLQRENLLLRTPGLNSLSERQMKALFATHDGELSPASLRQTAQELGFVAAPPPEVPEEETAAHDRMFRAAAGATPTPGADDLDAARIANMSEQEILAWARNTGRLAQQ